MWQEAALKNGYTGLKKAPCGCFPEWEARVAPLGGAPLVVSSQMLTPPRITPEKNFSLLTGSILCIMLFTYLFKVN